MASRNIIKAPKHTLFTLVERASQCADKKSPTIALGLTALHVRDDVLYGSSTDLDNSFSTNATVEVVEQTAGGFRVLVDGKSLADRIGTMPDGDVVLEVAAGNRLRVSNNSTRRSFDIPGIPFSEAPLIVEPPQKLVHVKTTDLRQIISSSKHAISNDLTRVVSSEFLQWTAANITSVATDGHRLMVSSMLNPSTTKVEDSLVPIAAVVHILRTLEWSERATKKVEEAVVELAITNGRLFLVTPIGTYATKLREGEFPPYKSIIPAETNPDYIGTIANRALLRAAVSAARVAVGKGGIDFKIGKGKIVVHAKSPDAGDATDELPCDYFGEERTVQLNDKYFMDALEAIDTEDVVLRVGSELAPAVLLPHSPATFTGIAIIMPMRGTT